MSSSRSSDDVRHQSSSKPRAAKPTAPPASSSTRASRSTSGPSSASTSSKSDPAASSAVCVRESAVGEARDRSGLAPALGGELLGLATRRRAVKSRAPVVPAEEHDQARAPRRRPTRRPPARRARPRRRSWPASARPPRSPENAATSAKRSQIPTPSQVSSAPAGARGRAGSRRARTGPRGPAAARRAGASADAAADDRQVARPSRDGQGSAPSTKTHFEAMRRRRGVLGECYSGRRGGARPHFEMSLRQESPQLGG